MNCFQREYQSKLLPLKETYRLIQDGNYIATGMAGCEPVSFLQELHTIADRISSVSVCHSLEMYPYQFNESPYCQKFRTESYFLMKPGRETLRRGGLAYIPGNMHNAATRQVQCVDIDVFVCAVCPMDKMGYFRTSLSSMAEQVYAKAAKRIILEVVPEMPVVYGDNEIHIRDVDAVYECSRTIPVLEPTPLGEVERAIGSNVATLVENGATIQLGIGAIPDAIAQAFMDKRDLGVHTEMITNSIVDLVEKGIVTGRCKTLHRGKVIGTFALGNQRLYNFLEHNPGVAIMSGSYVNDPVIIAKNDRMTSINTALAVDFAGQVSSESIGSRQYSGTGGQSDTAIGAIHAAGGKSIIAMRSTAKGGEVSTIMPALPLGSTVTLSRNNIDYIVTEYGIAEMKNRSLSDRTKALIEIAHPKFRENLTEYGQKLGFISL